MIGEITIGFQYDKAPLKLWSPWALPHFATAILDSTKKLVIPIDPYDPYSISFTITQINFIYLNCLKYT